MNIFEERRFGNFSFDASCIKDHPESIQALMKDAIVVRAEHLWDQDVVEYTALHPAFAPVEIGRRAPRYDVLFTKHPDGAITYEFKPQA